MKNFINANPNSNLEYIISRISSSDSEQDLINICSRVSEDFDTSYFAYTLIFHNILHNHKYKRISNIHSTWTDRYEKQEYMLIDPRFKQCLKSIIPVFWDTQQYSHQKIPIEEKIMLYDAHEYGLRAGILVSIYDYRGINGVFELGLNADLYNSQSKMQLENIAPYISYIGGFVHQAMIKLINHEETVQKEPLTKREKDCLCWAADGKTASEIGSELCISENTVKFHSKNIMKKLGAKNIAQAIAIGILNREINPTIVCTQA